MMQASEVTLQVQGEQIIATLPGTDFVTTYRRTAHGIAQVPVTMTDRHAPVSSDEFEKTAWEAAFTKAKELGWVG